MDFTQKACFVAGGHTTEAPSSITYSSMVSRDSVQIGFLIAALNNLDVMTCDVTNACRNAPCWECIWFIGGRECGKDQGKVMVVWRALYGLKSARGSWRAMFSNTLQEMGFRSTIVNPDVCIRLAHKEESREPHYEMALIYVDGCLVISHQPAEVIKEIGTKYSLKSGAGEPKIFLGANLEKFQLPNGRMAWSMSSWQYVKNAVKNVKEMLEEEGRPLNPSKRRGNTPLPYGYRPELDVTDMLPPQLAVQYMQLIGILRWVIELGCIDIATEVSVLSQYNASLREGHLEGVYHVFHYLSKHELS